MAISLRRDVGAHNVLFGTLTSILFLFAIICVISSIQCDHFALKRCGTSFLFLFGIRSSIALCSPRLRNAAVQLHSTFNVILDILIGLSSSV